MMNPKLMIELEEFVFNILKELFENVHRIENGNSPIIIIAINYLLDSLKLSKK